jgi:ABC-type multidrug transport system fused ATPase/permease subunit
MNFNENILSGLKFLFFQLSKRRKIQLIFVLVLSIISALFEVVSISALIPFMQIITSENTSPNGVLFSSILNSFRDSTGDKFAFYITLMFVILSLSSGLFRFCLLWIQTHVSHSIGAELSISIYSKFLNQPYSTHIESNSSDIISSISVKVDRLVRESLVSALLVMSSVSMTTAIITFLFYIEPIVALGSFGTFGLLYIIILITTRNKLKNSSRDINYYQNTVFKLLQEGLGGIKDIIINRAQDTFVNEYRKADIPLRNAHANIAIIGGAPRFVLEAVGFTAFAIIAFLLSNSESSVRTTSILALFAVSALRVIPLLQQIYTCLTSIIGSRSILFDVNKYLSLSIYVPQNKKQLKFENHIKFDNVTFRYTGSSSNIIDKLSIDIKKASRVGVIGSTGSGKSTFINIMMGLLTPTNGCILIDDQIIDKDSVFSWREKIAYVPQDIFLCDASIIENIALGIPKEQIDMESIIESAKFAAIYEDILSWSSGLDTRVGERGINLSGGQKQRIGIARALYRNPDILILDEATSALDLNTENQIISALESVNKKMTIIMIAHRLDTLRNCSLIIKIVNGGAVQVDKTELFGAL